MPEIRALYDEERIAVYQAFKPATVAAAIEAGRFAAGFNRHRSTWIKPSFGWMLRRSRYATAKRQEAILRLWLRRPAFEELLARSVPTAHDPAAFPEVSDWRRALDRTTVRHQWDPDRDLRGRPTGERAIQIGLSGEAVLFYADQALVALEDVTPLARSIAEAIARRRPLPEVPEERPYPFFA